MLLLGFHTVLTSDKKPGFGSLDRLYPIFQELGIKYQVQKEVLSLNPFRILIKIVRVVEMIRKNPTAKAFIGIDPINAFAGLLGKFLFNHGLKVIFYSVDYSKKRTGIPFLDKIYILLDEFVSKYSEETWSCSSRVVEMRDKYLSKEKNLFFPNVPSFEAPQLEKFPEFTLLFIGYLNNTYHLNWLLDLMEETSNQNKIRLVIIGNGENANLIEDKYQKLNQPKNISILGYIPRDQIIEYLGKSHIGLSLYAGTNTFNEYGDSLKVREYTHCLLPTITTDVIPNSIEIEKFELGKVVKSYQELLGAIATLQNQEIYQKISSNCSNYKNKFVVKDFLKHRLSSTIN